METPEEEMEDVSLDLSNDNIMSQNKNSYVFNWKLSGNENLNIYINKKTFKAYKYMFSCCSEEESTGKSAIIPYRLYHILSDEELHELALRVDNFEIDNNYHSVQDYDEFKKIEILIKEHDSSFVSFTAMTIPNIKKEDIIVLNEKIANNNKNNLFL